MIKILSTRCSGGHAHPHLAGGGAAEAAFYPRSSSQRCSGGFATRQTLKTNSDVPSKETREAMAKTALLHDQRPSMLAALTEQTPRESSSGMTARLRMSDGSVQTMLLHPRFRNGYKDESTQEALPRAWVENAIKEELDYFGENVWVGVPLEDALTDPEAIVVGNHWAICNTNERSKQGVRARLVAQEGNHPADNRFERYTHELEDKIEILTTHSVQYQSQNEKLHDDVLKKFGILTDVINAAVQPNGLPTPVGEPRAQGPGGMAEAGTLRHQRSHLSAVKSRLSHLRRSGSTCSCLNAIMTQTSTR